MRIGFTGTRKGMSASQQEQLHAVLDWMWLGREGREFHHGGAVGADTQACDIADRWSSVVFVPHLANGAYSSGALLKRNRDIVASSDVLIAAPESDREELRSGTWATVRYARQRGIPVVMLSRHANAQ